ncbi:MAG TPA: phosphatidate cytidylyltransferase [Flavisolibacter sp.]|nr:phosphatidate cytidylyltransferase [Flavisolibacter sp.]
MAFNWQTFRTRSLTAAVFVVVMLAGLLWNEWSFFLLFSVVHFGAWVEYVRLVEKFNPDYKKIIGFHRYGVMVGGWCLMLFFSNYELVVGGLALTDLGFWGGLLFAILLPLMMLIESRNVFLKNIVYSLFGLLYISLTLALLVNMRTRWTEAQFELSMTIPLLTIFSLWINDTMAYITGSIFGKTPLSPISPKKTWEGTIGGILLTILTISLIAHFTGRLAIHHAAIMAGLAAISGTYGDLFESKLKRMAGVKDSGSIMPGHGGFLDRFDSVLFAIVPVWLYASFL